MTARKICPTCGTENEVTRVICASCGVSLVGVDPSEEFGASALPPASSAPSPEVRCRECDASNTAALDRCVYCDARLKDAPCRTFVVSLLWPWGTEDVRESLLVGRDPPAPPALVAKLSAGGFDNVSRKHAKLIVAEGKVSIVDMGSSNGTFVNGVRLQPNVPVELESGTKLRFASDLEVVVQAVRGLSKQKHPLERFP
jgi:hypothetical protein